MLIQAKEEKRFKCTCGASYSNKRSLSEHIKKGADKEYKCEALKDIVPEDEDWFQAHETPVLPK
jgi:predicted SprT family Zn-dependent metalloprotease